MILTGDQIEEIKGLILNDEDDKAIKTLVEYTGCDKYDAKCLVEDYSVNENFELLLDKHWIEKRDDISVASLASPKLSRKEKFSLLRIFLPTLLVILITIFIIIFN